MLADSVLSEKLC